MAELKPNTRVAIYGRVSTRDKGQEVENQLAQLREFAAKQGWTISCEYADRESGASRDRIEFQEMFRDAAHRRFDLLLFWSLDRFTREGVLEPASVIAVSPSRTSIPAGSSRMRSFPFSPRSGSRKESDSANAYKPAWPEPAVGESGSAGRKRSWMPQELLILRSQGHSWREITEDQQRNCTADCF
jgi:hypothetical protein